jgi:hypothetical protein
MLHRFGTHGFREIKDKEYSYLFKLSDEVGVGL